jgi:hypothetical protein
METMGMTGDQDLYRPDETTRKDLGASPQPAARSNGNGSNGHQVEEERELTDQDMEAITTEMARYTNQLNGKSDLKGDFS